MIERLNQITLNDFIELSCGNYACLLSGREFVSESTLKEIASKLLIEYRSIVNPSNMKAMVMDKEDMLKERAKLLSLRICQTLVSLRRLPSTSARYSPSQKQTEPPYRSPESAPTGISCPDKGQWHFLLPWHPEPSASKERCPAPPPKRSVRHPPDFRLPH